MHLRLNGNIYIIISNPFNKIYVEQALEGIPYKKKYCPDDKCTYYRLDKSARDGQKFINNLGKTMTDLGEIMGYERVKDKKEHLFLFDKDCGKEVPDKELARKLF